MQQKTPATCFYYCQCRSDLFLPHGYPWFKKLCLMPALPQPSRLSGGMCAASTCSCPAGYAGSVCHLKECPHDLTVEGVSNVEYNRCVILIQT